GTSLLNDNYSSLDGGGPPIHSATLGRVSGTVLLTFGRLATMFHVEHCAPPLRMKFRQPGLALAPSKNVPRGTLPPSSPRSIYPQPLTLPTLHLISTFRRPIRVLHSFSNENFPSASLRHCR